MPAAPKQAQAASKKKAAVISTHTEVLLCELTDADRAEVSTQLTDALDRSEKFEVKAKATRAKLRVEKRALADEVSTLARALRTGQEEREVDVEVREGRKAGTVDVVRTDTEEIVDTRPAVKSVDAEPEGEEETGS